MSYHSWCLGIRVCRDKISCPPRQLNGGCIEGRDVLIIAVTLGCDHSHSRDVVEVTNFCLCNFIHRVGFACSSLHGGARQKVQVLSKKLPINKH